MSYEIDSDRRLIRMQGTGRVSDQEMIDCVQRLRADPALSPDMNTLSDMRGIEMCFTRAGVQRTADVMARTADSRRRAKIAIVVDSEVAFGMGRMFELYSEDEASVDLEIFRELDPALEWLGIA